MGSTPEGRLSVRYLVMAMAPFRLQLQRLINPAPFRGSLADLNNDGRLDLATG